jgi:site-specific DNA-cytosine methylase
MRINGLDLFSGIGGIALALHPWVQTVAYCEIEKYPQKVLLKNMERRQPRHRAHLPRRYHFERKRP